jgi:hypothetical protein
MSWNGNGNGGSGSKSGHSSHGAIGGSAAGSSSGDFAGTGSGPGGVVALAGATRVEAAESAACSVAAEMDNDMLAINSRLLPTEPPTGALVPRQLETPSAETINVREELQQNGFGVLPGAEMERLLGTTTLALRWIDEAVMRTRAAPRDLNPGAEKVNRFRFYHPGIYRSRCPRGERFEPSKAYKDSRDGTRYTTYLQPAGLNRDCAEERRFTPLPHVLLDHSGLQELLDSCFQATPTSLFPNQGRDWLKVGIHLIRLHPRQHQAGISSPNVAHVDGERVTWIILLERHNVIGGGSMIVSRDHRDTHPNEIPLHARLAELTLSKRLDTVVVDDCRVAHYVFPVIAGSNTEGWRSVLLIDFTPLTLVLSDELIRAD